MKIFMARTRDISVRAAFITAVICMTASQAALAESPPIRIVHGVDVVEIQAVAPNVVRIHLQPGGKLTPRTLVMDPHFQPAGTDTIRLEKAGETQSLRSPEMRVVVNDSGAFSVQVQNPAGKTLWDRPGAFR